MAASSDDVTADLKELVTCAICSELLKIPKSLGCLHTFCAQCLQDWYQHCQADKKPFICPSCRTTIRLKGDDVNELPTSFHHNSLIQLYNTVKDKKTSDQQQLCVSCSSRRAVVAICIQCGGMLCEECYTSHTTMKAFQETHRAILWHEFNKEAINSYIDSKSFCQEKFHEKCHLEFYCQSCKILICSKCAATALHGNHNIVTLGEASEQSQQRLIKEKHRLDDVVEMYEHKQKLSSENRERIQKQVDEAKAKLIEVAKTMNDIIQEKVQEHVARLDGYLNEQTIDNDEEQIAIDISLEQASILRDQCKKLLNPNLRQFLLEGHEKFEGVCQTCVEGTPILCTRPINRYESVRYVPFEETFQILRDLHIGKREVTKTDPSKCTIESVFEARHGMMNHVNIITRDAERRQCYTDKALIDVQIQDIDGNDVNKEITQSQPGTYIVKYKADKPSPYKLGVTIGGTPISNSPQEVETFQAERDEFKQIKVLCSIPEHGRALAINDCGMIAVAISRFMLSPSKVLIYSADGELLTEFGREGATRETRLYDARGVAFSHGNQILVSDDHDKHGFIKQFETNGTYTRNVVKERGLEFKRMCTVGPQGIACLARDGNTEETLIMLFCKKTCNRLNRITFDVHHMPRYLSYCDKEYFVTFNRYHYIYKFDENGRFVSVFGNGSGNDHGQLNNPQGLAVFGSDMLFVCDTTNHRVQIFNRKGEFITSFGGRSHVGFGQMDLPTDVAVTPDGRVLVLELDLARLKVFR